MKIYSDTKVYILCPANHHTGGIELLHQLCSQFMQLNVETYMFYYDIKNLNDPVDEFYKKYHLNYTNSIIDDKHNICIVPESVTEYLYNFKNIRRILWWLSVDNYLSFFGSKIYSFINNALYSPLVEMFYFNTKDKDIEHWVQSEYARQFVELNGISADKIFMVEDYVNQAFLQCATNIDLSKKENAVAFNPTKGFEVTKMLIQIAPNIKWCPIQNMTPEQVQALLAKCKVYVDFGNHPGKDRIPREAALSGCVVITGRRGSAANDIDINIPSEFKFNEMKTPPQNIIQKIYEVFENFEAAHLKQANYRERIMDDKSRFAKEVAIACELHTPPL